MCGQEKLRVWCPCPKENVANSVCWAKIANIVNLGGQGLKEYIGIIFSLTVC